MTNNPPTITTSASTASTTTSSNPSEVVVWKNIRTKGFWHKRILQAEELTNYNVILNDTKIPWSEISDVLVMNSHSVGSGIHYTVGSGRYARSYSGFSSYRSNQIGDVVFMRNKIPVIIYRGISDPHGLVALAKSIMKGNRNVNVGIANLFN